MKRDHAKLFNLLDVDIVDLTGNHINDYGYEVLKNTLNFFDWEGIDVVGGGHTLAEGRKPLIIDHNGSKIGWVACNDVGPYMR